MAASVEQIRRVVTQYESVGADKAAADLNAVAAAETNAAQAGQQLASITDIATKKQLSAATAYDRLRRSIDDEYRAQQQLAKGQVTLDRAMQQGVLSTQEYAKALDLLKVKYGGLGDNVPSIQAAGAATKLAAHEVTNLTAQVQDIGVSLAGGQSPFTVMLQQGSQISALMGDRGLKTIFLGLGSAITSMINPTTAVLAGFTALYVGATYAYDAIVGASKSAEDVLKDQERVLKQVKDAYDEATGAATKWVRASRAATVVETTRALADLKKELTETTREFLYGGLFGGGVGAGTRRGFTITKEFRDFTDVINEFKTSARGASDVTKLVDDIGRIGEANPALTETAAKLLEMLRPAAEAAGRVGDLDAALKLLQGTANSTDLSNIGLKQLEDDAKKAKEVIADLDKRLSLVGNKRGQAIDAELSKLGLGASTDDVAAVASRTSQLYDAEQAAQKAEEHARKAQRDAEKAQEDLTRQGKQVYDDTRTAAEDYANEVSNLESLLKKGAISQDTFNRAIAQAKGDFATQQAQDYAKALEKATDAGSGFTRAVNDYTKDAQNMAVTTEHFASDMFTTMEDALVEFVKTGKLNFSDLANSIIADMIRIAAKQAALGLLGLGGSNGILGAISGGGGVIDISGGAASIGLYHSGGIVGAETPGARVDNPALYANAPRYHSGRDPFGLMAGERRAIIKDDEGVFTPAQMKALGRTSQAIQTTFAPVISIDAKGSGMSESKLMQALDERLQAAERRFQGMIVPTIISARARRVKGV